MNVKEWTKTVIDALASLFVLSCFCAMVVMITVVLPVIAGRYLWNLVE